MCHQEPFPASYAQAFACLWDLVSPQHTHELRDAMTPRLTPMELDSIQTLEAHGNPRWMFTARSPAGVFARVRYLFDCGQNQCLWQSVHPRAKSLGFCRGARGGVGAV